MSMRSNSLRPSGLEENIRVWHITIIPNLSQASRSSGVGGLCDPLLLVCLREELARFDAVPGDSTRLVLTKQQLRELVPQFVRESNNQIRGWRVLKTRELAIPFLADCRIAEFHNSDQTRPIHIRLFFSDMRVALQPNPRSLFRSFRLVRKYPAEL
jgi:hypothetical protein